MQCKNISRMAKDYPTEDPETPRVNEPAAQYNTAETGCEELMCASSGLRTISEEEIARSYTLDEFKQHMDEFVESTHNRSTGCVELTPVVPRKCSIEEVLHRSMTIDQFTSKLYAMVDDFYNAKA